MHIEHDVVPRAREIAARGFDEYVVEMRISVECLGPEPAGQKINSGIGESTASRADGGRRQHDVAKVVKLDQQNAFCGNAHTRIAASSSAANCRR